MTKSKSITIESSNSLADLRERLKAEHAAVAGALTTSLQHAMACGDILIEAKSMIPHGGWLPWLETAGVSARLAQRYIRLAKYRTTIEANTTSVSHLGVGSALGLLATPRETGDEIINGLARVADKAVDAADGFIDINEREGRWEAESKVHEALRDEALAALDRILELVTVTPAVADFIENNLEGFADQLMVASAEHRAVFSAAEKAAEQGLIVKEAPAAIISAMSRMRDVAVEWAHRVEIEAART